MEDLDDFFAKKDKKKKLKTKDKKEEKKIKKKDKVEDTVEGDADGINKIIEHPEHVRHDECAWSDFQEEKETDYSGLKIQNLEIAENENGGAGADSQGEDDGEGGEGQQGPWKRQQAAQQPEPVRQEVEIPVEVPVAATTPAGGYIPPHLRAAQSAKVTPAAGAVGRGPGGRGRRGAPDLKNEENFPSLAAGMSGEVSVQKLEWAKKGFESVKAGASRSAGQNSEAPSVKMANRFDALSS